MLAIGNEAMAVLSIEFKLTNHHCTLLTIIVQFQLSLFREFKLKSCGLMIRTCYILAKEIFGNKELALDARTSYMKLMN